MRKIKLIVAVALLAASTAAKAQFTNTTATAAKATQTQVQGWGSVYVQWNPVTIAVDKKGEDDISANAFTIGYNKAFGIAKGTPLFVEAGIGLSYMFKTNEEPYEDLDEVGDYDWIASESVSTAPAATIFTIVAVFKDFGAAAGFFTGRLDAEISFR